MNLRIAKKITKHVTNGDVKPHYNAHQIATAKRVVDHHSLFVSVYSVEQCFGGPEEGGWWFDWWTLVRSVRAMSYEHAETLKAQMQGLVKKSEEDYEQGRAVRWASLPDEDEVPCPAGYSEGYIPTGFSDGEKLTIVIENPKGESASTERPHYC
jgi:hypothetical protein